MAVRPTLIYGRLVTAVKTFAVCSLLAVTLHGVAAPFQNLGFDEANTNNVAAVPGDGSFGQLGELLPGWALRVSGDILVNPDDIIGFNNFAPGFGNITLLDRDHSFIGDFAPVTEGEYHLALSQRLNDVTGEFLSNSLSQSGEVPVDARSIQFYSPRNLFELRANDAVLPLLEISGSQKVFAADISAFAGQPIELKFTTLSGPFVYNVIDAISFSSMQIPEPSVCALIGLGALTLFFGQRLVRK